MKYALLLERLDDRGSDATSTLNLTVERKSPPSHIVEFVGGNGSLSDGYTGKDFHFRIEPDSGFQGVALEYTETNARVRVTSCDNPLKVGGLLELEGDQCCYQITRLAPAPR